MKFEIKENSEGEFLYDIIYNGEVYGTWNDEKHIDCPEDLILGRDLNELINIGIKIGYQMKKDEDRNIGTDFYQK